MKKVLVTGGNGFLGKRLRQLLEFNGVHVIGSGLGKDRLEGHNHHYLELDVTNKAKCLHVLEENNPDVIINAAAMTNVDNCEIKQQECLRINTDSISNLNISKNRHFIQISTDFVFDGKNGPYSENIKPNPINYYGLSKYQAEKKLITKNGNYSIIRTCLVYGEDNESNNILMWVKRALQKNESLNIVDDQYRTPTFVDDLCNGIIKIINSESLGIYNISGAEYLSIFDFVCNIAKGYGFDASLINRSRTIDINQRAIRPVKSGLLIDKAKKDFDFNPINYF